MTSNLGKVTTTGINRQGKKEVVNPIYYMDITSMYVCVNK